MTLALMIGVLVFMSAAMAMAWLVVRRTDNGGWSDVVWTLATGAAGVAVALWPAPEAWPPRQALIAVLVAVWSLRLGIYIARRVAKGPEDVRYARLRRSWGERRLRILFPFMQLQAPVSALLCLSVLVAARTPAPQLRSADILGLAILAIAIAGEALADAQLKRFKADAARAQVCDRGLWGLSRHPNYFFEWLGWLAYPVIGFDAAQPVTWLTLIAPAAMFLVLRFGTGVPPLEAAMLDSKGQAYADYRARVSAFFPLPPKRKSAR